MRTLTTRSVLVGLMVLGACAWDLSGTPQESLERVPSGETVTDPDEPIPSDSEPFVRACGTNVYGELADYWRAESVVVGPLAFAYLKQLKDPSFATHFETNRGVKVLAVIEPHATATVIVPAHEREHLSLLYDPSKWTENSLYEAVLGDAAVTFEACPDGPPTQFNGGFLVAGARCADLDVYVADALQPDKVRVSFGAGECG
jgi:hypothetical protein